MKPHALAAAFAIAMLALPSGAAQSDQIDCDPETFYTGQEFVFSQSISYTQPLALGSGIVIFVFSATYAAFVYRGEVPGGYLYNVFGFLGDMC